MTAVLAAAAVPVVSWDDPERRLHFQYTTSSSDLQEKLGVK